MTLSIFARDETQPLPRDISMTLSCDGDHGLFPAPATTLDVTLKWPRKVAAQAGWKIRDSSAFCPECAGTVTEVPE